MAENKKIVVKVDVHDDEDKRKAMKAVSSHPGVASIAIDMKDKKLTVIGSIDPVCVAKTLKKWHPEILTVGPAKDEKKDDKKDDDKKKQEDACKKWWEANKGCYYPYMAPQYCAPQYCVRSVEECPSGCVIC